ncbi:hypothetical protein A3K73_05760 [Candidatus Pacearchaeota archaeon RBG_13_36_9]|nr:MAG: hypothetical protein A3K73_05760 [Candidatus Pacearchaeota archaeon RBG_13_36_9]
MALLTGKESEAMLKLFKDFNSDYNANSLSKEIKVTPRGALKILKNLEADNLVRGRKLGRAVFYKLNLDDSYVCKIIETLLIAEARKKAGRWLEEFKGVFKDAEIIIIFGSIIRNPKEANDIDVLFVLKENKYRNIADFIREKNKIMFKKIHSIPQTMKDLNESLKNNKAIQDAVRTGYVLHGQDELIEVMKNVSAF